MDYLPRVPLLVSERERFQTLVVMLQCPNFIFFQLYIGKSFTILEASHKRNQYLSLYNFTSVILLTIMSSGSFILLQMKIQTLNVYIDCKEFNNLKCSNMK